MKHYRHFLIILGLIFFAGCGELFMEERQKKVSHLLQCSVDPSALSQIFTRNIKGDLSCLEESLNLFVEIVKTDRPGNLSYKELTVYIRKNMDGVDTSLFEPLRGFFELNSLLSGDDPLYIKKQNIKGLISMLALINRVMVENQVYRYFTDDEPVDYTEHVKRKADVFNAFKQMETALGRFFKDNKNEIDLLAFLEKFKSVDNSKVLKDSAELLFIKKIILGGEKGVLTADELNRLLQMLADASKVVYDIIHLPYIKHSEDQKEAIIESLAENLDTLNENLFVHPDNEPLMTLENVQKVVTEYFKEFASVFEYKKGILKAKEILLKNNSEIFTGEEIRILVQDILLKNLRRGVFFYKSFRANQNELKKKTPITTNLKVMMTTDSLEEEFKRDFNRIARDYWFFVDDNGLAHYKNGIERSPWGMLIVGVLEDLVKRTFSHYTSKDFLSYGGYKLSQKQIEMLLLDFKDVVRGSGMILPGREMNAAETLTLMTSLFQKQSDGKGDDIEVNEMVEFLNTVITAKKVSGIVHNNLSKRCHLDYKDRYSPECFRNNFFSLFFLHVDEEKQAGKTLADYFPQLTESVVVSTKGQTFDLVKKVEVFTRACSSFGNGEPVPMDKGDLFMFYAGLLNMESTFIRFDQGGAYNSSPNNRLDPRELNLAYDEVYERAIRARVPKALRWRSRDVFFYLLDKGKEPGVMDMLLRIVPRGYPKKAANRSSVAGVLKVISEGSEANKINPYPCENLR